MMCMWLVVEPVPIRHKPILPAHKNNMSIITIIIYNNNIMKPLKTNIGNKNNHTNNSDKTALEGSTVVMVDVMHR